MNIPTLIALAVVVVLVFFAAKRTFVHKDGCSGNWGCCASAPKSACTPKEEKKIDPSNFVESESKPLNGDDLKD